jgi:hypothetical protein
MNEDNKSDIPKPITYKIAKVSQLGIYTLISAIDICPVPVPHKYMKLTTYFSNSPVKNLETRKNERVVNAP